MGPLELDEQPACPQPAGTVPNLEMAAAQQQAAGSACLMQPPAVQPYCSDASAEGPPRLENLGFQLPYRLLKTGSFWGPEMYEFRSESCSMKVVGCGKCPTHAAI